MPDTSLGRALAELVDDIDAGDELRARIARRERQLRRRPRLLVAAAIVVVVALIGGAVVLIENRDKKSPVVTKPGPSSEGWEPVAPFPLGGRTGAVSVWTGTEVLVWGGISDGEHGERIVHGDGAAYNPRTDKWRDIAAAPDGVAAASPSHAWTGAELVVWSGSSGAAASPVEGGAAYDPARNTWRRLADAPIRARSDAAFTWNGAELVIWGGQTHSGTAADGAAYDPVADAWTPFNPPVPPMQAPHLGWFASPGEAYYLFVDVASGGSYEYLPDTTINGQAVNAVPGTPSGLSPTAAIDLNGMPVVWGGTDGAFIEDARGWQPLPPPPTSNGRTSSSQSRAAVRTAFGVVIWPDRLFWTQRHWVSLPDPHLRDDRLLATVVAGDDLLVWSGGQSDGQARGSRFRLNPPNAPASSDGPYRCTNAVPVAATALPDGWSPDLADGDGSGSGKPGAHHWSGPNGSYVDVTIDARPLHLSQSEVVTVLDQPAQIGLTDDGFGARATCDLTFTSHGQITRMEFERLVRGVVSLGSRPPFALWPETTPRLAALASRRLASGQDPWRRDPQQTALHFADNVLGWKHATVSESDQTGYVHVSNGRSDVYLTVVRLVGGEWWSVTGVSDPDLGEGGSAMANARHAELGNPYRGSYAEREMIACRADRCASNRSTAVDVVEPWDVSQPGSLLLLYKDATGAVIHAWGFAIGPGEFAAG
jgi:hypothetical protein